MQSLQIGGRPETAGDTGEGLCCWLTSHSQGCQIHFPIKPPPLRANCDKKTEGDITKAEEEVTMVEIVEAR